MISEPFGLFKTVYETIYSIRLRERINSLKPSTNAVNMSRNRSTPCTPKTLKITSHQHPYKTVSNQGRQTNITNLGLADQPRGDYSKKVRRISTQQRPQLQRAEREAAPNDQTNFLEKYPTHSQKFVGS